jgi:hypothetical protein
VTTDSNTNAAEKPMSIRECLDAVHKAGGDAWDKVADPDGFIRWMRGSDDPKDVAAAEQAMQSMPAQSPASAPEQASVGAEALRSEIVKHLRAIGPGVLTDLRNETRINSAASSRQSVAFAASKLVRIDFSPLSPLAPLSNIDFVRYDFIEQAATPPPTGADGEGEGRG